MSTTLNALLAAQAILAFAMFLFAGRAWYRVRDSRTTLLAVAFLLLLVQPLLILSSELPDFLDFDDAVTGGVALGLGALVALYLGVLRR